MAEAIEHRIQAGPRVRDRFPSHKNIFRKQSGCKFGEKNGAVSTAVLRWSHLWYSPFVYTDTATVSDPSRAMLPFSTRLFRLVLTFAEVETLVLTCRPASTASKALVEEELMQRIKTVIAWYGIHALSMDASNSVTGSHRMSKGCGT